LAIAAALVAIAYCVLFNHDFSVNGLRYADDVERGVGLFHPNHLLPNALYRLLYLAAQSLGAGSLRAIWLMQACNLLAGVAAAIAIARLAALRAGPLAAVLVALLYAFGFAAFNFAEEPDVYVLPAAAVAISLSLLGGRDRLAWRQVGWLGLLAVFAVLTLQQYVLWYPALLALVAARDLGADRRRKLRVLAFGIPGVCLAAYLAIGLAGGHLQDLDRALGWFLGYAWDPQSGFGTYRPAPAPGPRLLGALLGLGNLVVAYEVVLSPLALAGAVVALGAFVAILVRSGAALRRAAVPLRSDAAIIATWCGANLLFATWWESRNIEFLFPLWVGALALVAHAAAALDRRLLAVGVVLIGVVNVDVAFGPQRHWPQRYRVAAALARAEYLGATDVLVTEELNTVDYLHYFLRADVRFQPGAVSAAMHASAPITQVRHEIDAELGANLRVYTTEIDEHGRLRELARRFAALGRPGFDGAVDRDIETLYRGLDVHEQPVAGARRLHRGDAAQPLQ
jgi:hypothetical protein